MEEKKRNHAGGDDAPLNYEDILNGFSLRDVPDGNPTVPPGGLDALAIAELLGGDVPATDVVIPSVRYDTGGETGGYAELARQFEDLDLGALAGDKPDDEAFAVPEVDDAIPAVPETDAEEDEEYAMLLGRLGLDDGPRQAASSGAGALDGNDAGPRADGSLLDFMDLPALDDDGGDADLAAEMEASATESGDDDSEEIPSSGAEITPVSETEEFSLEGLFAEESDAEEVPPVTAAVPDAGPEPSAPVETVMLVEPPKEPEPDFLGLEGMTAAGAPAGRPAARMETLFEGVEMDFEEQIARVTLAELCLAHGDKAMAAGMFQEIADHKGVTNWVARRLRSLAADMTT